jgi:YfiH family protein
LIGFDLNNGLVKIVVTESGDGDFARPAPAMVQGVMGCLGGRELVTVRQVHGSRVVEANEALAGDTEADALLVAPGSGLVGGVRTADCVPVVIADSKNRVVVAHAGWRGLVAGVLENSARVLGDGKVAFIGPHIKTCCYEFLGKDRAVIKQRFGGNVFKGDYLDLSEIVRQELHRNGVALVQGLDECTGCSSRFFSHRKNKDQSRILTAAIGIR